MQRLVEYGFLRTTEELSTFVPEWRRLWESDPRAMPFQSPDWLVPWWRQFGNQELCSLVIARDEKAISQYAKPDITIERIGEFLKLKF